MKNTLTRAAAVGVAALGLSGVAAPTAQADPVSDAVGWGRAAVAQALAVIDAAEQTRPAPSPAPAPVLSDGDRIVDAARSQIGTPYVWGGSQPGGFDCSGLTSWAYQQVGKAIPRTSQDQAGAGAPVAFSDLRPGDIIAFYPGATHVGIFSGAGNVIHAPQSGDVVKEASLEYMPFHSAVRF